VTNISGCIKRGGQMITAHISACGGSTLTHARFIASSCAVISLHAHENISSSRRIAAARPRRKARGIFIEAAFMRINNVRA